MLQNVSTYAIVSSGSQHGLTVPHLDRGELLEAIWISGSGLRLRAEHGSVWVGIDDATALSHWKGQRTLQVLETDAGRSDACWQVPLTGT